MKSIHNQPFKEEQHSPSHKSIHGKHKAGTMNAEEKKQVTIARTAKPQKTTQTNSPAQTGKDMRKRARQRKKEKKKFAAAKTAYIERPQNGKEVLSTISSEEAQKSFTVFRPGRLINSCRLFEIEFNPSKNILYASDSNLSIGIKYDYGLTYTQNIVRLHETAEKIVP